MPSVRLDNDNSVVYLGSDAHVHELNLVQGSPWTVQDATAGTTGALNAMAVSGAYGFYDGLIAINYESAANNHIHQLKFVGNKNVAGGPSWQDSDLTLGSGGL